MADYPLTEEQINGRPYKCGYCLDNERLAEAQSHIRGLVGKAQQVAAMLRSVTAKSGTWIAQHPEEVYSICDTADLLLAAEKEEA